MFGHLRMDSTLLIWQAAIMEHIWMCLIGRNANLFRESTSVWRASCLWKLGTTCLMAWSRSFFLQVQIRQKYAWPTGFCTTPRPRKDSWAVPCMERFTDFTARLMRLVLSGQLKKLSTSPQSRWRAGLCQKCPPFSQTSSSAWTTNTCVSRATRVSKIQ